MTTCPRCNAQSPPFAQFCAECGTRFASGGEAPMTRVGEGYAPLATAPAAAPVPLAFAPREQPAADAPQAARANAPPRTVAFDQLAEAPRPPATDVVLGRDPSCSFVLDAAVVSARHARILRVPRGLLVEDLGSTNGTFVNGARVQRQPLTLKDDLHLGSAPVHLSDPRIAGLLLRTTKRPSRDQPITIGSAPQNDIVVDHPDVAPSHVQLRHEGGAFLVRDLGSPAGTYVDTPSFRVHGQARLAANSILLLGSVPIPMRVLGRMLDESVVGPIVETRTLDPDRPVVLVGRAAENDIVLAHPTVSGRHARLTRQADGSLRVEDLGSTNGTYVDGERVGSQGAVARAGQRVIVGSIALSIGVGGRIDDAQRAQVRLDLRSVGLTVSDRGTGAPRVLLDDVTMSIFPGELVGMLGPSGAGKSTLLMSVLGLYRPTRGGVLLNGRPLFSQYESFRTNVGYVPQDDIVHPQLTVREALRYACRLRLPSGTRAADVEASIERTLKQVGLWEQRDLQIGSPEEKVLSGGQRRRVNLAVELVTDPSLLILDEPTSGLSWTDAADVVATLRNLADGGRTIVLTIHQPDFQEYEKFDTVAILGRGGKLVFYGPPAPDSYEFFGATPGKPREMFDHVEQVSADEWRARFATTQTHQRFVTQRAPSGDAKATVGPPPRPRPRSSLRQLPVLLARSLKLTLRNRTALALLVLQAPLLGLLIGLTTTGASSFATATFGCRDTTADAADECAVEDVAPDVACDPSTVQSWMAARTSPLSAAATAVREARIRDPRTGLLAVLMALFLPMIIASSNVLVSERTVYERERLAGLNVVPYVLARYAVLVALGAIVATLNLAVALPLLEVRGNPLTYWLVGVMITSCAAAMGLALSAAVRSPVSALWGINFLVIPQLLFAGSITRLSGLAGGASWLTATRYALEALSNVDLRARGYLRTCQIERWMENFPGYATHLAHPIAFAAAGTGAITFACLLLTMALLRLRDPRLA